jgi:hypothetical protein
MYLYFHIDDDYHLSLQFVQIIQGVFEVEGFLVTRDTIHYS